MTKQAALPAFEQHDVSNVAVKIVKAGDGLSAALKAEPKALDLGQEISYVLRGTVSQISHKEKDGVVTRVHTVDAQAITEIDPDVAGEMLTRAAEELRLKQDEIAGQLTLDAEAEAQEREAADSTDTRVTRAYRNGRGWSDGQMVPAIGIRRRIQALHAIGWSAPEIASRLGVTKQAVRDLCRPSGQLALPSTRTAVARVYDELWDQKPTGPRVTVTKQWARRNGWLPPLAWDDDTIDDPTTEDYAHNLHTSISPSTTSESRAIIDEIAVEQAMTGRRVTLNRVETSEAIARLTAMHYSAEEIGQRLGMSSRNVVRFRARAGESVAA
jgi:AraC-like DNA-binding protein